MSNERVLIIEDDPDIREGVRILLQSEDLTVLEAENGRGSMISAILSSSQSTRYLTLTP